MALELRVISGSEQYYFKPTTDNRASPEPHIDEASNAGVVPHSGTALYRSLEKATDSARPSAIVRDFGSYAEVTVGWGVKTRNNRSGGKPVTKILHRQRCYLFADCIMPVRVGKDQVDITHKPSKR